MEKLPDEWIDTIFMALRATYGVAFDRQFEPPIGSDENEAKRFYLNLKAWWKRELAPAIAAPHTIRYALDHLPAKAPNLIEFKTLCWQAPPMLRQGQIEQKHVPADPQRVAAEVAKAISFDRDSGPKAWAYRLKQRESEGARLTITQKTMWRAAIGG